MVYAVYLSNQSFNDCMGLLLISSKFTSYYVYIKDFNGLMFNKTKNKYMKYYCKSCLQCFTSQKVLNGHKEDCLLINGAQNVKLEKGFIEFKNFNRQIPAPFKIYAEKYQDHIPCSFAYKVVCIDDKYSKDTVLFLNL